MERYAEVAQFAQSWGLIYFVAIFLGVIAYAMWPSRKAQFEDAANIPLKED